MSWINCAGAAFFTAAAAAVVVQPGETLEQIAQRTLGDPRAAEELKSLNGLSADLVPPGTRLKLPGPERVRALSALLAARNALSQSDPNADVRAEASTSLNQAEQLFQAAKYDQSAAAADATWRLLSVSAQPNTRFAVQVVDGETTVTSKSGQPVRVEREGLARPVHPGQTLTLGKPPAGPLIAPALVSPSDSARVAIRPNEKGIGPVTLTWQEVAGAARYSVEVSPAEGSPGKPAALTVDKPEVRIPLSAGKYFWWVRAVTSEGEQSAASSRRTFELWIEPLKLEVKETHWK